MKTLRYSTETGQYTIHNGQYKTMDGNNGAIHPPHVQLEVVEAEKPEYTDTQKISMEYDISINEEIDLFGMNGTATEGWTVTDKTEEELINEANQRAEQAEAEFDSDAAKRLLLSKVEELDDEHIDGYASFFPAWKVGEAVEVDMRRQHNGVVYKVIQAHTTQVDWQPQDTPALWVRVHDPEGEIPEWSSFASHEFQHMDIGTAVMDEGTKYYLINPAQGHWKPSGAHGHHGWSTEKP